MVNVGSYVIKLMKSGIDKVKVVNLKMLFNDIVNILGIYIINKVDVVIIVEDVIFNYDV